MSSDVCALRRCEILIFALRTGGGVLTGMHVIFNYVTNVVAAAVGNADKFTEISRKFYSAGLSVFCHGVSLLVPPCNHRLVIAVNIFN